MSVNPFAGIKIIKDERLADIVSCTPTERDEAIALAQATEWQEWLAVPIAFYAGMRREEIANLLWPDIHFEAGLIVVTKTKTMLCRLFARLPLSAVEFEGDGRGAHAAGPFGFIAFARSGVNPYAHSVAVRVAASLSTDKARLYSILHCILLTTDAYIGKSRE